MLVLRWQEMLERLDVMSAGAHAGASANNGPAPIVLLPEGRQKRGQQGRGICSYPYAGPALPLGTVPAKRRQDMLSNRERERYSRQIMLFGDEGQERLKEAEIFIAGLGGLGSPVSLYLAAAGVGRLTIADRDAVDLSNLNRQILYGERDLGKRKIMAAGSRLKQLNPGVKIRAVDAVITQENVCALVGDADGIVDAMDNFQARYLLNLAALEKGIPFFHGAIRGFHGQATTIFPGDTPCLRCIFPHAPEPEDSPVLGAVAGAIGAIQATEVVKYLLGTGRLLKGRLLLWDGLSGSCEEIRVERDPRCPDCGMRKQGSGS